MTEEPGRTCLALRLRTYPKPYKTMCPRSSTPRSYPFLAGDDGGSAVYAALWANLGASIGDVAELSDRKTHDAEKTAYASGLGSRCVFGLIH